MTASPLLFERDSFITVINNEFARAQMASGRIVLVAGEAGIGKTSLLEHITAGLAGDQVLWGNCEALLTPQPLGPFHDIARHHWPDLKLLFDRGAARSVLFAAVIDELAAMARPAIMVLEDVHWADAATLDLIKYIGRRIHHMRVLLALSYRDDEITPTHPLRSVLGDLPAKCTRRLLLPRLSVKGVEGMAAGSRAALAGLYAITGGNPFFVTELLADGGDYVPVTIRDAVLGRAVRVNPAARQVLDLASLMPASADLAIIKAILEPASSAIDECVSCGLLLLEDGVLKFRHELARVSIEDATAPAQRRQGHAGILAVLSEAAQPAPLARLAHHAFLAGDAAAVLRLSPLAAEEAMSRGARREAAAHCRAMLAFPEALCGLQRAKIFEDYAWHCFEINEYEKAIAASDEAIALFASLGNAKRQSAALALQSKILVRTLRNGQADEACRAAIALLEPLGECPELARAHATWAYLRMLDRDYLEAIAWGNKAILLAQGFNDQATLAAAHNSVGAAQLFVDYPAGCRSILTSMSLAATLDDGGAAMADAYVMLGCGSSEVFEFGNAERYLSEGIEFARARDLDRFSGYMEASQALLDVYKGRWDAAGAQATSLVDRENFRSTNRVATLVALGRLRTRCGDPGASEILAEALWLWPRKAAPCSAWHRCAASEPRRRGSPATCRWHATRHVPLSSWSAQKVTPGFSAKWLTGCGAQAIWTSCRLTVPSPTSPRSKAAGKPLQQPGRCWVARTSRRVRWRTGRNPHSGRRSGSSSRSAPGR